MNASRPRTESALALAAALAVLAMHSQVQAAGPTEAAAANAATAAATATPAPNTPAKQNPVRLNAQQARGKHLVDRSGCIDCHTPLKLGPRGPEPDMSRHLSGHPEPLVMPPAPQLPEGPWQVVAAATSTAWSGPWGTSFTANLTPDVETGLGAWTARDFRQTFRTGKRMGRGRDVLPPMPIPVYNNYDDADLDAIFAYLKTLPAIKNRVPEPRLPAATGAIAGAPVAAGSK